MKTSTFSVVFVGLLFPVLLGVKQSLAGPVPAWTPSPAQASRLAPAVVQGNFRVRPPKGYQEINLNDGKGAGYTWFGPAGADGHRLVMLFGTSVAGSKAMHRSLAQNFALIEAAQARQFTGWRASSAESGTIHGMPFMRCRWSGVRVDSGDKDQGILYLALQGHTVFDFSAEKIGLEDKAALATAEASLLTFQHK